MKVVTELAAVRTANYELIWFTQLFNVFLHVRIDISIVTSQYLSDKIRRRTKFYIKLVTPHIPQMMPLLYTDPNA